MWTRAWSASFSGWTSCCRRNVCMGRVARTPFPVQAPVPARKVTGTAKPTGSDRRTPSVTPPPRHAPPPCPLLHAILIQSHIAVPLLKSPVQVRALHSRLLLLSLNCSGSACSSITKDCAPVVRRIFQYFLCFEVGLGNMT